MNRLIEVQLHWKVVLVVLIHLAVFVTSFQHSYRNRSKNYQPSCIGTNLNVNDAKGTWNKLRSVENYNIFSRTSRRLCIEAIPRENEWEYDSSTDKKDASAVINDLSSGKSISALQLEADLKRMEIEEIKLLQEDLRRRQIAIELGGFDDIDEDVDETKSDLENLTSQFASGTMLKEDFMEKLRSLGREEVALLEKAVLDRKEKVAGNLILKELQNEAILAAIGGAGVGLIPGLALALWLLQADETDLSLAEAIVAYPSASAVLCSLLVYRLSVPKSKDELSVFDVQLAKNIRTTFAAGPKEILSAASDVKERITGGPSWMMDTFLKKVYKARLKVDAIPFQVADSVENVIEDISDIPGLFLNRIFGEMAEALTRKEIKLRLQRAEINSKRVRAKSQRKAELKVLALARKVEAQKRLEKAEERRKEHLVNAQRKVAEARLMNASLMTKYTPRLKAKRSKNELSYLLPSKQSKSETSSNKSIVPSKKFDVVSTKVNDKKRNQDGQLQRKKKITRHRSPKLRPPRDELKDDDVIRKKLTTAAGAVRLRIEEVKQKRDNMKFQRESSKALEISVFAGKPSASEFTLKSAPERTLQIKNKSKAPGGIATISKWRRNRNGSISGLIFNSKIADDGDSITTSPVKGNVEEGTIIETCSGSRYFLNKLEEAPQIFAFPSRKAKSSESALFAGKSETRAPNLNMKRHMVNGRHIVTDEEENISTTNDKDFSNSRLKTKIAVQSRTSERTTDHTLKTLSDRQAKYLSLFRGNFDKV